MKYYIEITLIPSIDIPVYFLWEKIYQQIHLALVEAQDKEGKVKIGVSFPEYNAEQHKLGRKLRLFASLANDLKDLTIDKWLSRLMDYVHITTIRGVPEGAQTYGFFKRIQTKSSNARLARRKARRENITVEQALLSMNNHKEQFSNVPYIQMKSQTTGQRYRLMIGYEETEKKSSMKDFTTYGLSSKSSVPIF
ncbi:MAG: type I-F CRISPR-associated endoribonuclease Cas6/Csy4 [Desulfomicrobium sp.]|nr:type I-F CRISPR-associated endoribonuclease Cas6/Csy4 [Desulfomicrobium sp.]